MVKERLISAFFGVILLFIILLSDKLFINIAIIFTSVFILYELFSAFDLLKFGLATALCFTIPLMPALSFILPANVLAAIIAFYILILLACLVFMHGKITYKEIAVMFFFSVIITFLLAYITLVRKLENGNIYVWLVFIGAWISDTFAYFCGTALGKHKLAPHISPKKTVEGSVGGLLGTALALAVYGLIMRHLFDLHGVNYALLALLGVFCSVFGQIGDLSASIIKRECGIKDFGKILPGHGGMLDRFDSVLFVAPLVYYFLIFIGI
jgi:phosphatidate cytidylyltransferase